MKWIGPDWQDFDFSEDDENQRQEDNEEYYREVENSGFIFISGTHTWDEIQNAYKSLNLQRDPKIGDLPATPDDWLDTHLWIKSLKEVKL